tara:strand:- start:4 stop:396 length:393 start_codon:yes stop_codon:yes gene_type:complete
MLTIEKQEEDIIKISPNIIMEIINMVNFYYLLNFGFIILYIISYLGMGDEPYMHLDTLNEVYKIFIGITLIYFFNPWSKEKLTDFNKKIAFSAGLLLIFTSYMAVIIKDMPIIRKIPLLHKMSSVKRKLI